MKADIYKFDLRFNGSITNKAIKEKIGVMFVDLISIQQNERFKDELSVIFSFKESNISSPKDYNKLEVIDYQRLIK